MSSSPRRVLQIPDARRNARSYHPSRPQLLIGRADGVIAAWDLETGKELKRGTFNARIDRLAYSPDGGLIASASRDGGVKLFRAGDLAEVWTLQASGRPVRARVPALPGHAVVISRGEITAYEPAVRHAQPAQ